MNNKEQLEKMAEYQMKYIEETFTEDESSDIESIVAYIENEYNGFIMNEFETRVYQELKQNKLLYITALKWIWFNMTINPNYYKV